MSAERRIVNWSIHALVVVGFPALAFGQLVLLAGRAADWTACGAVGALDATLVSSVALAVAAVAATTRGLGESSHFHVARGAVAGAVVLILPTLAFAFFLAVFSTWVGVFYVAVPMVMAVMLMLALLSRRKQNPWRRPTRTITTLSIAVYSLLVVSLVAAASLSCFALVAA